MVGAQGEKNRKFQEILTRFIKATVNDFTPKCFREGIKFLLFCKTIIIRRETTTRIVRMDQMAIR